MMGLLYQLSYPRSFSEDDLRVTETGEDLHKAPGRGELGILLPWLCQL